MNLYILKWYDEFHNDDQIIASPNYTTIKDIYLTLRKLNYLSNFRFSVNGELHQIEEL